MKFDIVFVTYNSTRHIDRCFKALEKLQTPLSEIKVIVVDNNSTDNTIQELEKFRSSGVFPHFEIIQSGKNLGFGLGCNLGARNGNSPYIFFLNVDTELSADALEEISAEIGRSGEEVASWELRQMPYEHPKIYNPVTLETSWSSGAAVVVRRDAFERVKGFDKHIFMYAEDVDLSWNLRKHGYKLKYVPKATLMHYTYESPGQIKPVQYYNSILNNLLLRLKYGGIFTNIKGFLRITAKLFMRGPFENSRKILLGLMVRRIPQNLFVLTRRIFSIKNFRFKPRFLGWDYERRREGDFYEVTRVPEGPKVSILVRTVARPAVLRECLISLRNQTYKNLDIVVVEDGPNKSEELIKSEFSDLPVRYFYSGEKVGRCEVANIAMDKAEGEFLNFLDDDDLFYSDHVETLVSEYLKHPGKEVYYSLSFECLTEYKSLEPLKYKEHLLISFLKQKYNKFKLTYENILPIQAAMFSKKLYQKIGGFDTTIDSLEDWDFWIRCSIESDFHYVEKTTSLFRTPHKHSVRKERVAGINSAYEYIVNKYKDAQYKATFEEMHIDYVNALDYSYAPRFMALSVKAPILFNILNLFLNKIRKYL